MATKQSTVDYILDQLASAGNVSARKMFGEYGLYGDGKIVGLICDDNLYIKITEPGKKFVASHYEEGFPYPGAKPAMLIALEQIEDAEWLSELIRITSHNVPVPKPKSQSKKK